MNSPTPNLYQLHGLDRSASADELGRVLAQHDLDLENQAVADTDPRRRQLHTTFAVLSDDARRATYDDALDASLNLTWSDLEYLGNFGTLPDPQMFPQQPQQPQPQPQQQSTPYNYPTYTPPPPQADPFANPSQYMAGVPVHQQTADRPSAGLRLGMMLLDGLLLSMLTGLLVVVFGSGEAAGWLLSSIAALAYFIGFEVYTGASPVKHLFGYQVRDSNTGENLSLEQSAKRQWWRIVNIVPGIGWLISFIGAIAIGSSINPSNQFIGSHDRWAGAEVVRKPGR